MSTFTIDENNNFTAYASIEEARQSDAAGLLHFDSQAALAKMSAEWPLSRFVEIWNGIPGQTTVKKFQDRKKAVMRVWSAIQSLANNGPTTQPEPEADQPKRKQAKTAAKSARKATVARKPADKPKSDSSNKKAEV